MLRRLALLVGLLPLVAHASAASAAWMEDGIAPALGPARQDAGVDDDGAALRLGHEGEDVRLFSRRLTEGYRPLRGLRAVPYLEVESRSWDTLTLGWLDPAQNPSSGHFLVGAMASTLLAPHWTLSFDMAAGRQLAPESVDHPHLSSPEDVEEADVAWRTGVRLGYTLGKNLTAFSLVEIGDLQSGPAAAERLVRPDVKPSEATLRLGVTYRFP